MCVTTYLDEDGAGGDDGAGVGEPQELAGDGQVEDVGEAEVGDLGGQSDEAGEEVQGGQREDEVVRGGLVGLAPVHAQHQGVAQGPHQHQHPQEDDDGEVQQGLLVIQTLQQLLVAQGCAAGDDHVVVVVVVVVVAVVCVADAGSDADVHVHFGFRFLVVKDRLLEREEMWIRFRDTSVSDC